MTHNCHLKGIPCVKFCESPNQKHRCGINQRDKPVEKSIEVVKQELKLANIKIEKQKLIILGLLKDKQNQRNKYENINKSRI